MIFQMHISTGMILLIYFFALAKWTNSQNCMPSYHRFSQDHSFCKPMNPTCKFISRGLNDPKQIALILNIHNSYRSRLAMGKEHLAGGMPEAANMMEMVWDTELAAVAQKWAENCVYEHDCSECRQVENFPVGQNIAYKDIWCPERYCTPNPKDKIPAWEEIIKIFYDEVADFDHRYVDGFKLLPGLEIGHFTQMIWGNTWRIGCGYTVFSSGKGVRHFFVCNYGPTGNIIDAPIYQKGEPCSGCPINACCGSFCQDKVIYPGLCKMLHPKSAPIYPQKLKGLIFFCDFGANNKDCRHTVSGIKNWRTKPTLSGNIESIRLNGGQESHLHFITTVRPEGAFCLRIQFRKGPVMAGNMDQSLLSITFEERFGTGLTLDLDLTGNEFSSYSLDISGLKETKFTVHFSVPSGGHRHILDIKDIAAFVGECKSRKTDFELGFQS